MAGLSLRYLFRQHHWIYQVFAANTELGKTLFSAGIFQGFIKYLRDHTVDNGNNDPPLIYLRYLKPVQTGYPDNDDSQFIRKHVPKVETSLLVSYPGFVSPHLAAEKVYLRDFFFLSLYGFSDGLSRMRRFEQAIQDLWR
jgi:hypothetical protein